MSLQEIQSALSAFPGVSGWTVCERRHQSHQRYRIFGKVDSERTAALRTVQITIHTRAEKDGQPVQGEAGFTLTGDATTVSRAQLEAAVARATLVANPPYMLPSSAKAHDLPLADPRMETDPWGIISDVEAQMDQAAGDAVLCATELFADRQEITVLTSEKFSGSYTTTELFSEFVLLAEDGKQSVECQSICRARRPQELAMVDAVSRHARWAADRLQATLPPTGTFSVVFGEEALDTLFDTFVSHAGGRARYEGWSRLTEGKPLLNGVDGEALTLTMDPTVAWRMGSRPFDPEGQMMKPVGLIVDGVFQRRAASKRYADYLGIPATGNGGNQVVASGPTPLTELLQEGPVLHALRFSTFHPNPVTGAFSGELRTAYLHDGNGKVRPICGGSVSGNVWEAFKSARFSQERAVRAGYDGPAGVRLGGITVAGQA